MLQLEGQVDTRDEQIEQLQRELNDADADIQRLNSELATARREAARAVSNLRKQLSPLYQALRQVFGEMEAIGGDDSEAPANNGKWGAVKAQMRPRHKELVDLLLLQGSMKRTQISAALKMDYSNCTKNVIVPMVRAGWVIENGGELSLKKL